MFELTQDSFYKIIPLLKYGHSHPEILSVIQNNNPGWIFSDQIDSPRTALVWSQGMKGFYLIGDHNNDAFVTKLDGFINMTLKPRMEELGMDYFEVSGYHDQWNMESLFASRGIQQWIQLVFMLKGNEIQSPVLNDHRIRIVDLHSPTWRNQEYINKGFVNEHLDLFWYTPVDFYQKGYGYVAIDGKEIIGVCYSSFVTETTHAIGIEILPHYQKRGVGTHLASLVVKKIIDSGCLPYWDCSLDNEASKNLAIRLGFQKIHQYKCVGFNI